MTPIKDIITLVKSTLNLNDYIDTSLAEKSIRSNIYFRGPNAWILVIAMVIASIGLNVNSIPVIIGAMLISPLMGPIFGVGLGLGTNDMELVKASVKNLLVMVSISLVASLLYFLLTPLNLSNPSELLARTNPTIYDVAIALFGGFAGILEQCRKEKGTVFAGVAIATALMPPLCTAGFGLASGNFAYFIGATYLFVINCIFIMLATYISVKYLKFREVDFADELKQKKTRRISTILIILFIVPSIWSAVTFVKQNNFEGNAKLFVDNCKVVGRSILYDYKIDHSNGSVVQLFFSGEQLDDITKADLLQRASTFGIKAEQVSINVHSTVDNTNDIEMIKGIYDKMDAEVEKRNTEITRQQQEIARLQQELAAAQHTTLPYTQITREISGIYPMVKSVTIGRGAKVSVDSLHAQPCLSVILHTTSVLSQEQHTHLNEWLKIRLDDTTVELTQLTLPADSIAE